VELINVWIAWSNGYAGPSAEEHWPDRPTLTGLAPPWEPSEAVQAKVFNQGVWKLRSGYLRVETISDIVKLRETLQWIEEDYPGEFYVCGMWHFNTGEPVGGVGSPWFVKPAQLPTMLPNGVVEDVFLMAGQAKRKFV
jgi:hypothetical protein